MPVENHFFIFIFDQTKDKTKFVSCNFSFFIIQIYDYIDTTQSFTRKSL